MTCAECGKSTDTADAFTLKNHEEETVVCGDTCLLMLVMRINALGWEERSQKAQPLCYGWQADDSLSIAEREVLYREQRSNGPWAIYEERLLGAAMLSSEAADALVSRTRLEDFTSIRRAAVAAAIGYCVREGIEANSVAVANVLEELGRLDVVGGRKYLFALIHVCREASAYDAYIQKIVPPRDEYHQVLN